MAEEKNIDPLVFMQQELCDMWGINNQTKYVFYYDESNNCRKFWVDDSKQQFNTDHTADFVLAGLVRKEEEKVEASLETFRKPLKLQANVEEIKFKNLYAKGDFLQCVKERRLFETLSWIDKSPFYIHYTNVNNLFYTLVEIFDSIVKPDEISEFGYDYFKMKSVFYYMFKGKADALQILMFKYKYPNIQREDVEAFCNDLLFLLGSRREMKEEEKFLAGMLARAAQSDELVFLHDNDDYVMQENYAEFYADPIRKYQKSRHIFDEETTVQDIVKKQIAMGENMADNFNFVKSETDIFVQLSDVVAGILGKLFKYINSTSVNQRRRDVEGLSKLQVENILLIDKLRMEADRENPGFLCSIGPWDGIGILNRFFEMVNCLQSIFNKFGIDRISKLMITHLHYDHINGIEHLIKRGWIDANTEVWMNTQYPWKQPTYNRILLQLSALGVKFIDPIIGNSTNNIHILYPDVSFNKKNKAPKNNINNTSVLYQICFGENSMLFTGDIETEGWENVSTCMPNLCKSTYYCISHHGSITGHIRSNCMPANCCITTLADCADSTRLQVLMGRDGAYKGVYSRKVLGDFKNIEKTEEAQKYLSLDWKTGKVRSV